MTDTVFVRGSGGAIFQMDVPPSGFARERFDEAVAKEELVVLPDDEVEAVEVQGGIVFRHVSAGARADAETAVDLAARAAELGVKVDSRWGTKRLAAEVAKAEQAAERAALEERAREVFDADELEALDVMSNADLAAAIAAVEG